MKIAASILSWLGGALTTILEIIFLSNGQTVAYIDARTNDIVLKQEPYSFWLWFFWIPLVGLRIFILIYREISVNNGRKVAAGVLTLVFAGVLGGIFTLCTPDYMLFNVHLPSNKLVEQSNANLSENEVVDLIYRYKKLVDDEVITQEEFNKKKSELLKRQSDDKGDLTL